MTAAHHRVLFRACACQRQKEFSEDPKVSMDFHNRSGRRIRAPADAEESVALNSDILGVPNDRGSDKRVHSTLLCLQTFVTSP